MQTKRQAAANPQTNQPTWAVSPPVGCHHLHPLPSFISITQPKGRYLFYRPTEGRRLSRPGWLVTNRDSLPDHMWSPIPVLTAAQQRLTTLIETNALKPRYHHDA